MAFTEVKNHGTSDLPAEYFCEAADVATLPTTGIVLGSTCWVLDEKYGLTFDGSAWREV